MRKHAISRFICQQAAASDRRCLITAQVAGRPAHMTSEGDCSMQSRQSCVIPHQPNAAAENDTHGFRPSGNPKHSFCHRRTGGRPSSVMSIQMQTNRCKGRYKAEIQGKKYKKHKMPKHHITRVPCQFSLRILVGRSKVYRNPPLRFTGGCLTGRTIEGRLCRPFFFV